MPCPCTKCLNHIEHKVEQVQFHLFKNGIDLSYTKWSKQGEKDEPLISALKPVNATTEFVDDTYFASDIPTDGPATTKMVNATKDNLDKDDLVKFQELLLDAEKPLYEGCPDFTKFSAIVKLLNLKGKYGCSDKFFTELQGLLKKMLPADSQAWRTIDEKFPKIAEDPRNLQLGISADGVDVNRGNRHHKPLVDDLHTLFETRVDTYDAFTKDNFNLRVVVLWTINDYPALSTLCGCPYSGFKGCVVCGKDTNCVRLSASSKQKKNVAESLVGTLLHVPGKTKDRVNARLDLAELGVKPELFAMQEEDKTNDPSMVERELAISKESVSETVRWISYGPCATVVKYDAYNINGYTFRTKCHDGKVYQNSGVSVEAIDLHISKEVATTRQAFYYGFLQKIWVLDYRFRQIPLFKCDWVNHRAGGVKRDNLGYTLVDMNNLGHKVDPFILASQARQVFYMKDQIDKKLSIGFKTPPKNYKDTYDEVDEEFSTVIHQRNDNILPCVNRRDLGNESRDDYYRTDCGGVVIRKSK
ncbi:hypothetical protein Tco_0569509 [Tanacetum coccineum]